VCDISCHDFNRLIFSLIWSLGLLQRWLELSICILAVSSWGEGKIWRTDLTDCLISMLYVCRHDCASSGGITFF
jgi:hypothetical protein